MAMTEYRPDGGEKVVNRSGMPAALTPQHILLLREIVPRMPHATLDELAAELDRLGEVRVCTATIRRTLLAQGIVRSMSARQAGGKLVDSVAPAAAPKRYGYTAAHRRDAGQYSTDLTDAEWHLVADLFERPEGNCGAPARYERRHLVNACCHMLRTGCAWRLLPS
ncbi:MAG: transposase [Xylophilus ampelinus]